ncbi:MAG: ABC transporter permease [Acidimicrobiales bacterium]|nr:ABC transporter permease [Acidimicrobiales bacterium]
MKVLAIALNSLRRLTRTRANLFFVFALPMLMILVLGLTVGSATPRIGVYVEGERTPAVRALIDELETIEGADAVVFDGLGEATDQLKREDIDALVTVPDDYGETLESGGLATLSYSVIPGNGGLEVQGFVRSAVAAQSSTLRATRLVVAETDVSDGEAATLVAATAEVQPTVSVRTVDADGAPFIEADIVGFVAAQELVLFVFVMSMVLAGALIQSKRLGVTRRMMSTAATTAEVVAGEALGRYLVAVAQSAVIVASTALFFGLDWGSWPATLAIVAAFCLVATAAALLIGAVVRNESQSQAVGISVGLALAALGGCMVPFEVFPDSLRTLAHITPHAWAVDAFTEVVQRGGGIAQIGTELAVLVTYGLVVLAAATFMLRRSIVA